MSKNVLYYTPAYAGYNNLWKLRSRTGGTLNPIEVVSPSLTISDAYFQESLL